MAAMPTGRRHSVNPTALVTLLVSAAVTVLVVVPIGRIVVRTFVVNGRLSLDEAIQVLHASWLLPVLRNTFVLVAASTTFAVVIGSTLAWLNERTDANLGIVGLVFPIIPLLIPNVALAIGWVFIATPKVGFLNGLLASLPLVGARGARLSVNIHSWPGLLWVYTIHSIPYVYLVVSASLRSMDPAIEEASCVCGATLGRTLRRVSLPAIRPALIAASLIVVISGFGLYSVPSIIATPARIDLLSVQIVHMLTAGYPPRFAEAQVLGVIMLMIIGALWVAQQRVRTGGQFSMMGGRAAGASRLPLGRWRIAARGAMIGYIACVSVIPLLALVVVAFMPYWQPTIEVGKFTLYNYKQVLFVNRLTMSSLKNSLILSGIGATISIVLAAITALQIGQTTGVVSRIADAAMKVPAAVPHLIVALGFLVTFSGPPFHLAGTLLILLLAFVIIYTPSGSVAANSAVAQVGKDLREASYISGAGEGRTIRRIVVPLALPGFVAGWTMVFVHMMGDLSAAALLCGIGTTVIGFAILEIWDTGSYGLLAAFSTLMCLVITTMVVLTTWFARHKTRR